MLSAGTPVDFEIVDGVSSKTAHIGDRFRIALTRALIVDGVELIPVGAAGEGEVIHAAKAAMAGKAGELVLAVRFIEHGGRRLPLRGFHYGLSGVSRINSANALNTATAGVSVIFPLPPLGLLISGRDAVEPAHCSGNAKISSDVVWEVVTSSAVH